MPPLATSCWLKAALWTAVADTGVIDRVGFWTVPV